MSRCLKRYARLARDRRPRLAQQELAQEQVVEERVDVLDVRGEMLDRALPEHPADDGRALEQGLPGRRQVVDAGRDQRLERVRDAIRAAVRAALDEHADRLLDEERVPLRALQEPLRKRRRQLAGRACELGDELLDEQLALLGGERLELDRRRAHAPSTPSRTRIEELRTREADDQERRANPVREMLDEVEQRLLRPVDVLEVEDERLDVREALHDLACGPGDLLLAALALERLEHPGREPEHVRDLVGAALFELLERLLEGIVVGDACGGLDHLGERPVGDALAVWQAAAGEDARALEPVDELARETALADAGLAEDREQVRALVAHGAGEGVGEELELRLAADERRSRAGRAHWPL